MGNEGKCVVVVEVGDVDKALKIMREIRSGSRASIIGGIREQSGVTMVTTLAVKR